MLVMTSPSIQPVQIEVEAEVERSCKGSLHFRPSSTMELTQGELDYIKTKQPALYSELFIIGPSRPPKAPPASVVAKAKVVDVSFTPEPAPAPAPEELPELEVVQAEPEPDPEPEPPPAPKPTYDKKYTKKPKRSKAS